MAERNERRCRFAVAVLVLGMLCACGAGGHQGAIDRSTGDVFHDLPPQEPPVTGSPPSAPPTSREPCATGPLLELTTFQNAVAVLGQDSFNGQDWDKGATDPIGVAFADAFFFPQGMYADHAAVWVADFGNNRVLRFDRPITAPGPDATLVLGQGDMVSDDYGLSEGDLYYPSDVIRAGDRILVSDSGNNRVLIWTRNPTQNGAWSKVVIGQSDFTSNAPSTSRFGLSAPTGLRVVDGKLFIVDAGNNRVLVYDEIPTTNGSGADLVIGQPDFDTRAANLTNAGFDLPYDVWADCKKLAVTDGNNNRVLIWDPIPTTNGAPAQYVLGHEDFRTKHEPADMVAQGTFLGKAIGMPVGIDSNGVQLVVVDSLYSRVLIWNSFPAASGSRALPDVVLGQGSFYNGHNDDDDQDNSCSSLPTARTLHHPHRAHIHGKELFVDDTGNNRILIFR